jgi:RHS repeat-associated protein
VYDWRGRRRSKVVSTWNGSAFAAQSTNRFVYDDWNQVAEMDATNNLIRSYLWGLDLSGSMQGAGGVGGLVAINIATNGVHFAAYDGNGNVSGLVKGTNGAISAQYEYGAFGELIRASGSAAASNPCRFSTKFTDDESDFLYFAYRFYNASTGRWPNRDPLRERGGMNLYAYVFNRPLTFVDPMGLSDFDVALIEQTSQQAIDQMTRAGERSGNGAIGGALNNLSQLWRRKHKACGEQSDVVVGDLLGDAYDDDWRFSIVTVLEPFEHQFIVAHSDNPDDPTLIIDPLKNKIREVTKSTTYPGILISSDTFVKPWGNSGVTQLNAFKFY